MKTCSAQKIICILFAFLMCTIMVSCSKIDITGLEEALAKEVEEDLYTAGSYNAYVEKYNAALEVYNSKKRTKKEVGNAVTELNNAIDGLIVKADFSALDKALEREVVETKYTKDSYAVYLKEYNTALEVSKNKESSQEQVDSALESLNKAFGSLIESTEISELQKLLLVTVDSSLYTTKSYNKYLESRQAAEALIADKDAKELYLKMAASELSDAIDSLVKRGDIAPLNEALQSAKKIYAGTSTDSPVPVGVKPSDYYTKISYTNLGNQISKAEAVVISGDAGDDEISGLVKDLYAAISALKPKNDLSGLNAAINMASSLKSADYTAESYNALLAAVSDAKKIAASEEPSLIDINDAIAAINNAYNALVPVKNSGSNSGDVSGDTSWKVK